MREVGRKWQQANDEHHQKISNKIDKLVEAFEIIEKKNAFIYGNTKKAPEDPTSFRTYAKRGNPNQADVG